MPKTVEMNKRETSGDNPTPLRWSSHPILDVIAGPFVATSAVAAAASLLITGGIKLYDREQAKEHREAKAAATKLADARAIRLAELHGIRHAVAADGFPGSQLSLNEPYFGPANGRRPQDHDRLGTSYDTNPNTVSIRLNLPTPDRPGNHCLNYDVTAAHVSYVPGTREVVDVSDYQLVRGNTVVTFQSYDGLAHSLGRTPCGLLVEKH